MPMDGFTLAYMTRELKDALTGARVDRVNQPERDALLLLLRNQGKNVKLLLTANADQARVQLTEQNFENPAEPPMITGIAISVHLRGNWRKRDARIFWSPDAPVMSFWHCCTMRNLRR